MKIIQWILSLFTSQFQGMISTAIILVAEDFFRKSQKIFLMMATGLIFSVLLTAGILISLIDISLQYDSRGVVIFSAMLTSGLSLSIISLLVLTLLFWPKKTAQPAVQEPTHAVGTLDQVLGSLAQEAVHYLKQKNDHKPSH